MRLRVCFAVAVLALAVAPAAGAATLPSLPGMGVAQKAVGTDTASTAQTTRITRTKRTPPTTSSASASSSDTSQAAAKTIRDLPGGGALPVIGKAQTTSSHSALPGADSLLLLAALGSFTALGALYSLRRLGRI
jgi:hypothetical protein